MRSIPFYPLMVVLLIGLGGYLGCDPNNIEIPTGLAPAANNAKETASGCTAGIVYRTPYIWLTVGDASCEGNVYLDVLTSLHEQWTFRLGVRLPLRRREERRVSSKGYNRGSVDGTPFGLR